MSIGSHLPAGSTHLPERRDPYARRLRAFTCRKDLRYLPARPILLPEVAELLGGVRCTRIVARCNSDVWARDTRRREVYSWSAGGVIVPSGGVLPPEPATRPGGSAQTRDGSASHRIVSACHCRGWNFEYDGSASHRVDSSAHCASPACTDRNSSHHCRGFPRICPHRRTSYGLAAFGRRVRSPSSVLIYSRRSLIDLCPLSLQSRAGAPRVGSE